MSKRFETYDLSACTDCLMLIANGDTPEMDERETADYLDAVARFQSDRGHYVPSSWPGTEWTEEDWDAGIDREGHFSWSPCDVCRRPLGGDRYPVAEMVEIGPDAIGYER